MSVISILIQALEAGATVAFGIGETIGGKVHFRIDLDDPDSNFFYGKLNPINLELALKVVLNLRLSLPKFITESGFPEGVTFSFALKEASLPDNTIVPRVCSTSH